MTFDKAADYYETDRSEFLDWVGGRHARVLDIGCGSGANAAWYRQHGATEIVGVEVHSESAAKAASVMDLVLQMPIEAALADLHDPFDLIVCADVLEHLTDPWSIVARLRDFATEGTVLAISIPNIRFLPALIRVAVGRGFAYEEQGIFDAMHLRFFTRADVDRLARSGGWNPERWGAPTAGSARIARTLVRTLTLRRSDQWLSSQIYMLATRQAPSVVPRKPAR